MKCDVAFPARAMCCYFANFWAHSIFGAKFGKSKRKRIDPGHAPRLTPQGQRVLEPRDAHGQALQGAAVRVLGKRGAFFSSSSLLFFGRPHLIEFMFWQQTRRVTRNPFRREYVQQR